MQQEMARTRGEGFDHIAQPGRRLDVAALGPDRLALNPQANARKRLPGRARCGAARRQRPVSVQP